MAETKNKTKKTTTKAKTNSTKTKKTSTTKKSTTKKTSSKKTTTKKGTAPKKSTSVKQVVNKEITKVEDLKPIVKEKDIVKEEKIENKPEIVKEEENKFEEIIKQEYKPLEDTNFDNELKKEIKEFEKNHAEEIKFNNNKNVEYYNILENEKHHYLLKFFLFLILLAGAGFAIYQYVIKDKKAIFSSGLNAIYKEGTTCLDKLHDMNIFNDPVEISGVLKVASTIDEYKQLSDYNYNVNLKLDNKNKDYALSLGINKNEKKLFDIGTYYLKNELYVDFNDNYNKIIKLNNDITSLSNQIKGLKIVDYNKLNTSAKKIKDIINSNISRDKITTGEETIYDQTYNYVSLKLSSEEYSSIITNIINDIKDNKNLINNLAKAFSIQDSEVENMLDDILKNTLVKKFDSREFKFYATGIMSKIVGLEIKENDTLLFRYVKLDENNKKIIVGNNTYIINIKDENNKTYIDIKKENEDYATFTFNEKNDKVIDLDYKFIQNNYYGNIHLDRYNKEENKSGNIKFSIVTDKATSSFNFDYRFKDINEIKLDKETININEVSEDDYLNIYNSSISKLDNTPFKEFVKSFIQILLNY